MIGLKKWAAIAATATIAASVLAGCGGNSSTPAPASTDTAKKAAPVSITVWSHFGDDEAKVLDQVAQDWAKKTGNTVTVVTDKGDMNAFPQVAASGKGPDVMF
ncbi:MAG: hypothetical protein ACM3XM_04000, partial [Mycobacterium leprae]